MADKTLTRDKGVDARMREAVSLISRDERLRFFIRTLLECTGVDTTPDGGNALDMARAIGRHSVGSDIIGILARYDPLLYPAILREYQVEVNPSLEYDQETTTESETNATQYD